jgi:hypothetical protein
MFVKATVRRRGDKEYRYLSLVEAVREGPKVVHRTPQSGCPPRLSSLGSSSFLALRSPTRGPRQTGMACGL